MKSGKIILSFLLLAILIIGCVPSKPTREEQNLPAERLIKKLEANRRRVKTFRGTGVIKVESPQFGATASFEVSLRKPDSIKINVVGPFGIDLAEALVTTNEFRFYDSMNNRLYKGRSGGKIIKKILKVDLDFNDLMDAFAGAVNLTEKLRRVPDKYLIREESYTLIYVDSLANKISSYYVDPENYTITEFKLNTLDKEEVFKGNYYGFREYSGVYVPQRSTISNNAKEQTLSIEYRTVEINEPIESFELKVPKDAEVIEWTN